MSDENVSEVKEVKEVSKEEVERELSIQDEKTFNRNKWFFCCGGIGRDMLYTLVSTYFLQYVQFGLTLTWQQFLVLSLLIGILGRIWDGINDPMMGAIIDGSHLKWGKFKPWIFWGAVLDSIFTILLFNLRPNNGWVYIAVICAVYLLWEASFTMNDIGYWSMIPSLSRTKSRRDKMTTLTIFFAGIGTIIMTGLVTFFSPGSVVMAYSIFSIIAAVCVVGCQTMTSFGVKEAPREEDELKEENKVSFKKMIKTIVANKQLLWISLAMLCSSISSAVLMGLVYNLYYLEVGYNGSIFIFLVIYAVCNTVLSLIYPKMAEKIGRKKIQLISFIIVAFGYVGLALIGWTSILPFNIITLCIFGLCIFAGGTWFYMASVINLNNCVEYNEFKTGKRNEAVVTTMRPLIVKFADAFKYLIVTLTLIFSGLYAITNGVSSQETQKSQFEKKVTTVEEAKEYVQDYQKYYAEYKLLEASNGELTSEEIDSLDSEIKTSQILNSCQVQAEYLEDIGHMYLVAYNKTTGDEVAHCQLYDAQASILVNSGDYNFELLIILPGSEDGNSADQIYADATQKTRIILRISCTVIPLILYTFSWLIQRDKFIIDEKYFDDMMKQIALKKEEEEKEKEGEVEPQE